MACGDTSRTTREELWRLRLNWCFVILVSLLYSISTTGISSSFHQFVTNPRAEDINNQTQQKIEPGLGESELFYSLLISCFNIGSIVGGITTGLLSKFIPQFYLWLFMLTFHTIGYLIYALASEGWLIIISKLLSGYFLGADLTIGFSYLSKTSILYSDVQKECGVVVNDKSLRNTLFALNGISFSVGYFLGPGAAVIFAQFQYVNQFRAVGWYNAAWGMVLILLLFIMFRGESSCSGKKVRIACVYQVGKKTDGINIKPLQIAITMLLLAVVEICRFGILETLFNPILSDSFGLNERNSSYVFLCFGLAHTTGSLFLYGLEKLNLSSQMITLIAMLLTIGGYLLLGDWQAILFDPCTAYSPFHHPDLLTNDTLSEQIVYNQTSTRVQLSWDSQLVVDDVHREQLSSLSCNEVQKCSKNKQKDIIFLEFGTIDQYLPHTNFDYHGDVLVTLYCSHPFISKTAICVTINGYQSGLSMHQQSSAQIESIQILSNDSYWKWKSTCMHANITGHTCHWIPSSLIARKECEDCPPICRSLSQTLNFAQFILGLGLLLFSNSLLWVSLISLLFNQLPSEHQSILMGIRTTLNGLARTVLPLILDAAYEGTQKRTFPIIIVLVTAHLPFLAEIILFYRKLGPQFQATHHKTEEKNISD